MSMVVFTVFFSLISCKCEKGFQWHLQYTCKTTSSPTSSHLCILSCAKINWRNILIFTAQRIWHNMESVSINTVCGQWYMHAGPVVPHCVFLVIRSSLWIISALCSSPEVCVDSMSAVQDFPVEHQAHRRLTTSRIRFYNALEWAVKKNSPVDFCTVFKLFQPTVC